MPHVGTHVPDDIFSRLTLEAQALPDTDWHVGRLYDFLGGMGIASLRATHSRYVVDLNRPADGTALYPGQDETGLIPATTFDREPIYMEDQEPTEAEIGQRVDDYWRPYHQRLAEEIEDRKQRFGYALLWDAHSIRSFVPRFFDGNLPDLNLGTGGGVTADPLLAEELAKIAAESDTYSVVLNQRFKGGYITRHYGEPERGVHAVQLELTWDNYMDEDAPYSFDEEKADRLRPVLKALIAHMSAFRPSLV